MRCILNSIVPISPLFVFLFLRQSVGVCFSAGEQNVGATAEIDREEKLNADKFNEIILNGWLGNGMSVMALKKRVKMLKWHLQEKYRDATGENCPNISEQDHELQP